jgi:hypothetical protein
VYPLRVQPDDVITGGDNFLDLQQDTKVQAALHWLQTAKSARRNKDSTAQKGQ